MANETEPKAGASAESPLQTELNFYRRRVDELASELLRNEYAISHLRHRIHQKLQGFAILSKLSASLGLVNDAAEIFKITAELINGTMAMDRTVIFTPAAAPNVYVPAFACGYAEGSEPGAEHPLELPESLTSTGAFLLVHKKTPITPELQRIRDAVQVPYFLCVPVSAEEGLLGILFVGRTREARPMSPPLDDGDADSLSAIAALISATVRNMRIRTLEQMDKLKTELFANISHELRTPITLTLGPLAGIRSGRFGQVPAAMEGQLGIMERNQKRLLGLINQILDLAKLEAGALELSVQHVPRFNDYIRERAELFREALEARGIQLLLELEPLLDSGDVYVDPLKFENVLLNILSNAFKFTSRGHVAVKTAVTKGQVLLVVEDTGPGLKNEQLGNLFQRFNTAGETQSTVQSGTGIGLAFAKEMAKLHGGDITVRTAPGVGTAFTVAFPLGKEHFTPTWIADAPSAPTAMLSTAVAPSTNVMAPSVHNRKTRERRRTSLPTVLYVDDSPELRAYVPTALEEQFNVLLAEDGVEGLEIALSERPDLILSDLQMPRMDGEELCRRVRAEPSLRGIPFVLLTAQGAQAPKLSALESGADDYMTKPFSEHELRARVSNLTKLRRQQMRLSAELEAARKIQLALLPPQTQKLGGLQVEAIYLPCEGMSGDFFDTIWADGRLFLYVADVTSHGTAAAQVTYLVKTLLQNAVRQEPHAPLNVLSAGLRRSYAELGLSYDVTLQLARVDTVSRTVDYVLCGAAPPIRVHDGVAKSLPRELSSPLSATNHSAPPEKILSSRLESGDLLVLYTDGCHEFDVDGRPFGMKRLLKTLGGLSPGPGWRSALMESFLRQRPANGFPDDLTLLGITFD